MWKNIKGWEGLYEISDEGYVKSLQRRTLFKDGRIRIFPQIISRGGITKTGYYYVTLRSNEEKRKERWFVHRLVAKHFIPNPENKPQVNHKDGNKLNPHFSNLEWSTNKENSVHAFRVGLTKPHTLKMSRELIDKMREEYNIGGISQRQLGEKYGLARTYINGIIAYKHWK